MSRFLPANRCRTCGATSYRRVVARDGQGALRSTELYQCSGCSVVFADPKAWREGGSDDAAAPAAPVASLQASSLTAAEALAASPRAPDLGTYGQVPSGRAGER